MKRLVLGSVLSCGLVACGSDFDPGSRVTKLRLLAVQADAPYARPGETVSLRALAVDPRGRAIQWGWATCLNPASSSPSACLAAIDPATTRVADGADTHTFTVPEDALEGVPVEGRAGAFVGVVVVACPGTIGLGDTSGVPVSCTSEGRALRLDEFEIGMKRIAIRESTRNANPVIESVRWDGAPWPEDEEREVDACTAGKLDDCPDATKHAIAAYVTGIESGVDERGVAFTEQPVVQYYASEGWFSSDVRTAASPETKWAARAGAAGTTVTMWIVARDDRGGVTWTTRRVRVR